MCYFSDEVVAGGLATLHSDDGKIFGGNSCSLEFAVNCGVMNGNKAVMFQEGQELCKEPVGLMTD
jgi:hypothetical protein